MDKDAQYLLLHKANQLEEDGKLAPAVRLLRRLARLGNVHAQVNLGNLLGDKVRPPRPQEAVYWYKRAVRKGLPEAAWAMAMHYRNLPHRKFHWEMHWLKTAADMELADARREIRNLERHHMRG